MTDILPISSAKALRLARRLLRDGEVIAFPTDTIYGLGANAFERYAIREVFAIKERPTDKGLPVFIAHINDLNLVAHRVPNQAWPLLNRFWPGALTVILPRNPQLPADVSGGQDTVAVRIPDHAGCLELVTQFGQPLIATSANLSGHPTPATAQEVATQLGGRIPLILDGGPSPQAEASTIVDLTTSPPRIVRAGALATDMLQDVLPGLIV